MLAKTIQRAKNIVATILINLQFDKHIKGLDARSVAIDCGANVGDITAKLTKKGAKVYAFEPNPYAFAHLQKRFAGNEKVVLINKAVWDKNTKMNLHFHQHAEGDDLFWSFGSSIMGDKINVNNQRSVEIEVVDLIEFIEGLNEKVNFLKIDVEGAECEILEKLIQHNLHQKIDLIVAEVHDSKIPNQKAKTDRVRHLIKDRNITNINLAWL